MAREENSTLSQGFYAHVRQNLLTNFRRAQLGIFTGCQLAQPALELVFDLTPDILAGGIV